MLVNVLQEDVLFVVQCLARLSMFFTIRSYLNHCFNMRAMFLRDYVFSFSNDLHVQESFPYSVLLPSPDHEFVLFPKGRPFPTENMVGHTGNIPFSFHVTYKNEATFPAGISPMIGSFMFDCPYTYDLVEKFISLIVQAYNEELRLPRDLEETLK
ncbi:hypothetical protein R6Q59_016592 [Mikania micrantha]